MAAKPPYGQRDYMRKLAAKYGLDRSALVRNYARAERSGLVRRKSRLSGATPEEYALALWRDGTGPKGWLNTTPA
jgi:DNA-binding transcriptional MocR family regulator